jgi:hypothetical protein
MRTTLLTCLLLAAPLALGLPGPAAAKSKSHKAEAAASASSAASSVSAAASKAVTKVEHAASAVATKTEHAIERGERKAKEAAHEERARHADARASAAESHHEIAWTKDKPADTKVKDGIEGAEGATARCKDGSYSHAKQHSGACSRHGGVAEWLK